MYNYKIHMSYETANIKSKHRENSEKTNIFFGIGRVFLFTIEFPRCMTRFLRSFVDFIFVTFAWCYLKKGLGVV